MPNFDPEIAAYARVMQREEESNDIDAFINAYQGATGEALELIDSQESPDAVCARPDGSLIGLEHTRVRRSPDEALWESIMDKRDEMNVTAAVQEIERLILQKAALLPKFKPARCMLLIAIYESDFDVTARVAAGTLPWLEESGFEEIWLGDFQSIRDGAHRELRLFGLYPNELRSFSERSVFDQKPYG